METLRIIIGSTDYGRNRDSELKLKPLFGEKSLTVVVGGRILFVHGETRANGSLHSALYVRGLGQVVPMAVSEGATPSAALQGLDRPIRNAVGKKLASLKK